MATQSEDYISKDFPERVKDEEANPSIQSSLEGVAETVGETLEAPIQVVREVFYDPTIKTFMVGLATGVVVTILIFIVAHFI